MPGWPGITNIQPTARWSGSTGPKYRPIVIYVARLRRSPFILLAERLKVSATIYEINGKTWALWVVDEIDDPERPRFPQLFNDDLSSQRLATNWPRKTR